MIAKITSRIARRRFLRLAASAAALPALTRGAAALHYPTRTVRLIVGFPAGGPNDICARLVAAWLSERLGKPIVVENRAGAAGNLATEYVVRAPADGHTLIVLGPPSVVNASIYAHLSFSVVRDVAPVAGILRVPEVLVVNPRVPAKTLAEFIAYAKTNPGKVNYASAGSGTMPHVAGELFKQMAGLDLVHVPYRGGGPALIDLMGGQVQAMFETTLPIIPHVRAGKLRALAVASAERSPALPNIPAVGEILPGYEAAAWYGIGAPKDTPREIVELLNIEVNAGLADPTIKQRVAELGGTPLALSSAEFARLLAADTEKWGKVVRAAHIKAE
jgi:tripartite-type tricarboxylate transporter receptor subunit TctC